MVEAFFYGMVLSLGLIIPLGVQNIFVFNQGITQRRYLHALPGALTAFACDFALIAAAVMGVSELVSHLPFLKEVLLITGGLFLIIMGWLTWNNHNSINMNKPPLTIKAQILFTLSVSLLNPHALLDTITVIGTNSLQFHSEEKYAFMLGCALLSLLWFLFLSLSGHLIKKTEVAGTVIPILNKVSAGIMWVIAWYLLENFWTG